MERPRSISNVYKQWIAMVAAIVLLLMVFLAMLVVGPVDIPLAEVIDLLLGRVSGNGEQEVWRIIIFESRLPMAVAAVFGGAALSAAGLLMQTVFRNPLAGPSVLGVSSGASLGVAVVMLFGSAVSISFADSFGAGLTAMAGAFLGAGAVIGILLLFSTIVRRNETLLIVGLMISYLCSSLVSLLNFFSPAEGVKSFAVWGMGSFMGLGSGDVVVFLMLTLIPMLLVIPSAKPLNALLLGERYAANMGHNVWMVRTLMLLLSGWLTAVVTAYCGPIGFIGLVVPHIARMLMRTSNHSILLPSTMLFGGLLTGICALVCVLPENTGVIPVNAVTPIIGVPMIVYIIINKRRL